VKTLLSIFVLIALFMSGVAARAKVPPLLDVPDYLSGDVKRDLDSQRADLEKRIASLRGWADRFNTKCGDRKLSEDDPLAKDCLDEKAKLNQAGQDYTRDALAFDDDVLKATAIGGVASARDATIITPDGRTLSADDIGKSGVNLGSHILTGPNGRMQVLLNDETVFTLGPNSDMVLDQFVYDPATSATKAEAHFAKGTFRWVTGKIVKTKDIHIKVPVGDLGVRGTDFDCTVDPDGAGYVKLHEGHLEITGNKTGDKFQLNAGQMVKFHADGKWEPITSLDAAQPSI
jgi:FecR protein